MKVGKQMQAIQPEMERLKEKYKDDQQKLNQEMMNLYREKGVNPAAMGLGCLPMFLQMPIWIALYAVLYFAVELRHTPAFWGVFQRMTGGEWLFMADLSAQDHFFMFPAPLDLGFLTLESINLLPILMMGVFFLQQKYTTAPTTAQSEQAQMQQRMMKWMIMIIPLMLYKAPCGLTLYILTSTGVGVVESYRVRKHLRELEAQGRLFEQPKKKKSGGLMQRLADAAQQVQEQQGGPGGGGQPGVKRKKNRARDRKPGQKPGGRARK
jgi:YidC/Oxa1 family membrane protein insertase